MTSAEPAPWRDPQANSPFDRSYVYDHAARLTEAKTGSLARGGSADDGPYQMTNFAAGVLKNTTYRTVPMGESYVDRDGPHATGASTNGMDNVFINSQGPFFDYNINVPGVGRRPFNFGIRDQTQFAALLLLHELGHQVGLFGPDANDAQLNLSYTQAVIDTCFPELAQAQR